MLNRHLLYNESYEFPTVSSTSTIGRREVALLIETGGRRQRVPVSGSTFTIGRSPECDAVIADFRVSRIHAKLVSENGEYLVLDAGSRHGTFLNGRRCERAAAKNHD